MEISGKAKFDNFHKLQPVTLIEKFLLLFVRSKTSKEYAVRENVVTISRYKYLRGKIFLMSVSQQVWQKHKRKKMKGVFGLRKCPRCLNRTLELASMRYDCFCPPIYYWKCLIRCCGYCSDRLKD
jgi:hypothetical protein